MKKYLLPVVFTLTGITASFAQDIRNRAEKYLADLASSEMCGRGYVENGMQKAAHYIRNAFIHIGLQKTDTGYFQPYTHPVNTFPDSMRVDINGKRLVAGKDYITEAYCGTSQGNYRLKQVDENSIYTHLPVQGEALCYTPTREITDKDSNAYIQKVLHKSAAFQPVIYVTTQKLTWTVATEQTTRHALIRISRSALPDNPVTLSIHVKAVFVQQFHTQNVIGYIPASRKTDKYIVFTAHYDHLGKMGADAVFRGANDNASGTAMMLCLAEKIKKEKRKFNYVFIAFGSEEAGLIGSSWYCQHPQFPLEKIRFLINLDLTGTGQEGITVVNATEFEPEFNLLEKTNRKKGYLKQVKKRGPAANSDHYPFYKAGVRCFFIYGMGGSTAYHDIYDVPEQLPLDTFEKFFLLLDQFKGKIK